VLPRWREAVQAVHLFVVRSVVSCVPGPGLVPGCGDGIFQVTLFRWKAQALIDDGVPSVEADELAAAKRRIAQLEVELTLTRDACALFDEQAVVTPKESRDRRRADRTGAFQPGGMSRHGTGKVHLAGVPAADSVDAWGAQDRRR
jgi:hypothetical protein